MIVYAPRRVTLAPRQPQSIRIAARAPQGLADGEYRVHLLFRAIPPANARCRAKPAAAPKGLSFALTPVYGVTIPVIVRLGNLEAKAGIANVHLDKKDGQTAVALDLSRSGRRSTFGEVRVLKPGVKDPIAIQKAVAVYTEAQRPQGDDPARTRISRATPAARSRSNMSKPSTTARTSSPKPRRSCARPRRGLERPIVCPPAEIGCAGSRRCSRWDAPARSPPLRRRRSAPAGRPIPRSSSCSTSTSASCGSGTAFAPTIRPKAPASCSATW